MTRPECPNCLRPVIAHEEDGRHIEAPRAFCWEGIPCRAPDGHALSTAEIRDLRAGFAACWAEVDRLARERDEAQAVLTSIRDTTFTFSVAKGHDGNARALIVDPKGNGGGFRLAGPKAGPWTTEREFHVTGATLLRGLDVEPAGRALLDERDTLRARAERAEARVADLDLRSRTGCGDCLGTGEGEGAPCETCGGDGWIRHRPWVKP